MHFNESTESMRLLFVLRLYEIRIKIEIIYYIEIKIMYFIKIDYYV